MTFDDELFSNRKINLFSVIFYRVLVDFITFNFVERSNK